MPTTQTQTSHIPLRCPAPALHFDHSHHHIAPPGFTGKERDAESGNDYFGARYYGSSMGRFLSPDWAAKVEPVPYAKLDNPQSLNLYVYVLNNPLSKTDPDGHGDKDKDKKLPPPDAQHNHTITVRDVSGKGINLFNHVTVQVDNDKEVGYGPKQPMTGKELEKNTPVPGQVEARDPNAKTLDQVTIHVTADQAKAAEKAISDTAKDPGNYVFHGDNAHNCANFGELVVNKAGGHAPNDVTPGGLVHDVREQQYKNNSSQTQ
jgi:RHS repeat-associated protein